MQMMFNGGDIVIIVVVDFREIFQSQNFLQ